MTDLASGVKTARPRLGAGAAQPHPAAVRGVRGRPPGLPEIMLLVGDKLAQVEQECRRHLRSEVGVIDELGRYIAEGGASGCGRSCFSFRRSCAATRAIAT